MTIKKPQCRQLENRKERARWLSTCPDSHRTPGQGLPGIYSANSENAEERLTLLATQGQTLPRFLRRCELQYFKGSESEGVAGCQTHYAPALAGQCSGGPADPLA